MTRKSPPSPLQELAAEADKALALCWERLQAKSITPEDIGAMVDAWRVKRKAHLESAEVKQARKEERQSDEN